MSRIFIRSVVIAFSFTFAAPAMADDGAVLITQANAAAGNVTPGDAPGFPVTLSVAGSYVLGSNLIPGANRNGIVAAAPDITIDLNGFVMSGGPAGGANNSLRGIVGQGDRLTVQNGKINSFEVAGIAYPLRQFLIVENMRIISSGSGIDNTGGAFARIQNNTVAANAGFGILCGNSCHVESNIVSGNGGIGITLGAGMAFGNTITTNGSFGLFNNANPDVLSCHNVFVGNNPNFSPNISFC